MSNNKNEEGNSPIPMKADNSKKIAVTLEDMNSCLECNGSQLTVKLYNANDNTFIDTKVATLKSSSLTTEFNGLEENKI